MIYILTVIIFYAFFSRSGVYFRSVIESSNSSDDDSNMLVVTFIREKDKPLLLEIEKKLGISIAPMME